MPRDGLLTKGNKSNIQAKNTKFLRRTEGKTRMDRIVNYIFREKLEIQNLLTVRGETINDLVT
jgi:hypothetical protein